MKRLVLALAFLATPAWATHHDPPTVPGTVTLQKDGSHDGHFVMPAVGSTFVIPPCGPTVERKDGIHYLTKAVSTRINGPVTLTYTLAGDGVIVPTEGTGPRMALYFQRNGDDWSAAGKYAAYRWYAKTRVTIVNGTYTYTVALDYPNWGPVISSSTFNTLTNFEAAKTTPRRVGVVFGGSVGAGHGVCTTSGTSTMKIVGFSF
jgi:hypothetical protein